MDKQFEGLVIVCGPQACGKSTLIYQKLEAAGLNVVEDWDGESPVPAGSVVETNLEVFSRLIAAQ